MGRIKKLFENIKREKQIIKKREEMGRINRFILNLDSQLCIEIEREFQNFLFMGERHSLLYSSNPKEPVGIIARYVRTKNNIDYLATNSFDIYSNDVSLGKVRLGFLEDISLTDLYSIMDWVFIHRLEPVAELSPSKVRNKSYRLPKVVG